MKTRTITGPVSKTVAWPSRRRIAAATAEIRSKWSDTERRHRAEVFRQRLAELATALEPCACR